MSNNMVTPSDFFSPDTQVANIALIACPGAEVLTKQIETTLERVLSPSLAYLCAIIEIRSE